MKMKIVILSNHKGSALLFTVIAITSIAVLGTGIYFMTSTSTFSGISANDQNRAYQLAVAGKEYAMVKNFENTATLYPGGRDFTFDNGDMFRLVIEDDRIESTGIVKKGTPYEARRTITAKVTGFSSRPDISFSKDIADFKPASGKERESTPGFVSVDTTTAQVSLGQQKGSAFGAVWYKGNSAQGNCLDGKCDFHKGIRAFFVFKIEKDPSYALGDGFTFSLFNGEDNDLYSVGGHEGRGELMGYAGSSYVSSSVGYLDKNRGDGIRPPKIAVEFDPYPNTGIGAACTDGNRKDTSEDHMAYVFWGDNSTTPCSFTGSGSSAGKVSYDDNQHGTGDDALNEPKNAASADTKSYFTGSLSNWLERTYPYAFRIEIERKDPGTGNYNYEVKSWIKECPDSSCSTYKNGNFGNTKEGYGKNEDGEEIDPPTIQRTENNKIELDSSYHIKFNKFLYGWTAATGGARQNIVLKDFKLYFTK